MEFSKKQIDYICDTIKDLNMSTTFRNYNINLMSLEKNKAYIIIDSLTRELEIDLTLSLETNGVCFKSSNNHITRYDYDVARTNRSLWWFQVITKQIVTTVLNS